jgi:hypothetical protein
MTGSIKNYPQVMRRMEALADLEIRTHNQVRRLRDKGLKTFETNNATTITLLFIHSCTDLQLLLLL